MEQYRRFVWVALGLRVEQEQRPVVLPERLQAVRVRLLARSRLTPNAKLTRC